MINENFVLFGVLLQFFTGVGYVIETIKGIVKPNRISWFLWALAPLIAFFAEVKQGVGIQSLLTFIVGFVPLLVFLSSFINKDSYWQIKRLDIVCGILSLFGLSLWLITKVGNVAILFSIMADIFASIPTLVKVFHEPETEQASVFLAGVVLGILTLLTIKTWSFAEYAFPVYITLMNILIASTIQLKIGRIFKSAFNYKNKI